MKLLTEELKDELDTCSNINDLMGKNGLVKQLVSEMMNHMLEGEMNDHLGYDKHKRNSATDNRRNGVKSKQVKSNYGEMSIDIPQDRESDFSPQIIKKHQRNIEGFEDKIISLYANGMTTRDITGHIQDLYGVELSAGFISNVTDKIMGIAKEWQARPLDEVYAVVFFDAIHYKVRESGRIVSKAAYTVLGINLEGKKDILGIWIGENEGAKFWATIVNELKNRGVNDILIACMDGLKGLPEAIQSVYHNVEIQLCIIHMIRNSLKFIPHKKSKEFIKDLKCIYTSPSQVLAEHELENLIEKWDKQYPLAIKPWVENWDRLATFFKFPSDLRRLIYTTNSVEAVHRHFRKVTKNKSLFPTDDSLFKILYMTSAKLSKKWTMPIQSWKIIVSQLSIFFEGRLIFK